MRRWVASGGPWPALFAGLPFFAIAVGAGWAPQPPVAIVDALVVDGSGSPPRVATVLLRGGRIERVGPRLPIPDGARVIPADGLTLLPGFFDLHEHVPYAAVRGYRGDWIKNLQACLASGVTTVVDFGRDPESFAEVREVLSGGRFDLPRVVLAARFAVPSGHGAELGRDWFSSLVVTPLQAEEAFRSLAPNRPDALKLFTDGWRYGAAPDMADMPEETVRRLAELARDGGMPTFSHTVTLEKAKQAARAGVGVLAHAVSDQPVDSELTMLMLENGTCYAPTMAVYEPSPPDFRPSWTETLLEPSLRRRIPALEADSSSRPAPSPSPRTLARWENIQRNTKTLRDSGVKVALGTDAGVAGTYHGWAVLRELELLVDAGLTPLQALQAATRTSADCIGVLPDRGTIEEGKRADLVLVQGAPHEKITDVWNIRRVFLDGREVPRGDLFASIQREEPTVPALREARALIDDFESEDGRSSAGSLWRADFESGRLTTSVAYARTRRDRNDRCLSALVQFAADEQPFARLALPLSRGAVTVVDASAFGGVEFEARGDGPVRFEIETLEVRDGDEFGMELDTSPEWTRFKVPFASLRRLKAADEVQFNPARLLALAFRLTGPSGQKRFLEIDNLSFR